MDQSQFTNSSIRQIHQISNAKVMYDTVVYCTHTTPILYWCCIICPSLASVNMYNATSSITFSYFSGRSCLKVVRKSTDVSHSLTVPKVFLPNPLQTRDPRTLLQTTFTSITLFNWDSFHLLMQSLHVLITYWISASKPSAGAQTGLPRRLLNYSYSILDEKLIPIYVWNKY